MANMLLSDCGAFGLVVAVVAVVVDVADGVIALPVGTLRGETLEAAWGLVGTEPWSAPGDRLGEGSEPSVCMRGELISSRYCSDSTLHVRNVKTNDDDMTKKNTNKRITICLASRTSLS
jgi:hypothetical protein